jgi:thiamine kinase-like enzyme
MELIGKGLHADLYDNGDGTVTKVYRPDTPAALYLQDYEISSLVARRYARAPAVHGLKDLKPYPGIVFDKIEGPSLLEAIGRRPSATGAYARLFAAAHLDIHRHSGEGLPRQKDALSRRIAAAPLPRRDIEDIQAFADAVPEGDRLCHNDYMPTNAILCGEAIVAVDWRTATCGNALADLARTLILHQVPREDIGIPAAMELVRRYFISAYVHEYLRSARVARAELEKWMLPLSAIRLGEGVSEKEGRMLLRRIRRILSAMRK